MTFPRTKIQPPRPRAAFVGRGALETDVADALLTRRLVLLCAPAGYGKTMLLAHELARLPAGTAVAWVAVDHGDDLQMLLACMLAALEPIDPPWRVAPEALVARVAKGSPDDDREVAAEVINTLEASEVAHGVIAFDDLHRVDDPALFRFLDVLVARLSSRWTIAIASRTEPPLSLARWRAADDVAEFRQLRLTFARDEARRLAEAAGLDQPIADRVFDRTQGWPAGMRIAVGALRATGNATSRPDAIERALRAGDRPMFEFLISEVLDELRPELADFLLRASVLPVLDAERCARVTGMANAGALLHEIERLGLFVDVLDEDDRALRLHDLLRDAMQQHLSLRDPELLASLRRSAAETEPDPMRRAGLLLDAGDNDEAANVLFEHGPSVVATAGPAGPGHLIDRFPPAYRDASPRIAFVRALVAWFRWDFAAMAALMERAESGFSREGDAVNAMFARPYRVKALIQLGRLEEAAALLAGMTPLELPAKTRIIMLSALYWLAIDTGRLRVVAPLVDEMVTLLGKVDRIDLWYHTTPPHRLPGLPGVGKPLARHAAALLRVAGDEPTPLRALALFSQAWCAMWEGRLPEAYALRERARDDARWCGDPNVLRGHFLALTATLEALAGRPDAAMEAAFARVRLLSGDRPWSQYVVLSFAARIASTCDDRDALRDIVPQLDALKRQLPASDLTARTRSQLPVQARLAWLLGRRDDAIATWHEALAHEEEIDFLGQAVQTRCRLALALAQGGDRVQAAGILAPVFARIDAEGSPGAALLATDSLRDLAAIEWDDVLDARQQAALKSWWGILADERARHALPLPAAKGEAAIATSIAAPLTARELEVLGRIAAGDSNKHIARALDLSLHTVKRHVANILGKLDVETRGQAAAWYRGRR